MPKRTDEHVTGDIAVSRVIGICNACGWAADRVLSDYGEDVVVQPFLYQLADPFRILIQVKGTKDISRHKSKRHGIAMLVPKNHARKWCLSLDLTIVVLWDVSADRGFFVVPRLQFSDSDLLVHRGQLRLRFDPANGFTERSLKRLAWGETMDHLEYLLRANEGTRNKEGCAHNRATNQNLMTRVVEFLRVTRVMEEHRKGDLWRLNPEVEQWMFNAFLSMQETGKHPLVSAQQALAGAVVMKINLETGQGARRVTLSYCLKLLAGQEPARTLLAWAGHFGEEALRETWVKLAVDAAGTAVKPNLEKVKDVAELIREVNKVLQEFPVEGEPRKTVAWAGYPGEEDLRDYWVSMGVEAAGEEVRSKLQQIEDLRELMYEVDKLQKAAVSEKRLFTESSG